MSVETEAQSDAGAAPTEETGIDWEALFNRFSVEFDNPQSLSQLSSMASVADGVAGAEEAAEKIQEARESGDLVKVDGGYIIASHHTPSEPDTEDETPEPTESETTSEDTASTTDTETVEVSVQRLNEMEKRVDAISKRSEYAMEMAEMAVDSLRAFAQVSDDDVLDQDLFDTMNEKGDKFERMANTITKVSQQLEEVGEVTSKKQPSTAQRITAIRQWVVKKTEEQENFGADYKRIESFFDNPHDDESGISPSYASNLLSKAAEDHPAFHVEKGVSGNKQLRVDLDKIGSGSVFRLKNSTDEEGG